MELAPACREKVTQLLNKGTRIPNPTTLDIGEDVRIEQISGENVTIYPGCRIYGGETVISSGVRIGYEGPATVENCQIGPDVELRGGYFSKSVFLRRSSMGLGAQVREACILEEEASGAHCVGLKQTILFPFVTLGSLINFCDCLMAGGTSRQNHSEVGSSYVHFNFTPEGDKTTPSLIGDVPRGVMLNQRPIFLGGQGGMVGPLRIGYGNVVAAGSILRQDYPEENTLIVGKTHKGGVRNLVPGSYPNFAHLVENNILYLANLAALEEWYRYVRRRFLETQEFGSLIYGGLIDKLSLARKERVKRLQATAQKACTASGDPLSLRASGPDIAAKEELCENVGRVASLFFDLPADEQTETYREEFLSDFFTILDSGVTDYIGTIRGLPKDVSAKGVRWLDHLAASLCMSVSAAVPSLRLFPKLAAGPC